MTTTPTDPRALVERLRAADVFGHYAGEPEGTLALCHVADILAAADYIEALQAELARLRGALDNIASDDKPELGNRNTNDLLARMYWLWATEALAAEQRGGGE